jgi:hypothetical protein
VDRQLERDEVVRRIQALLRVAAPAVAALESAGLIPAVPVGD